MVLMSDKWLSVGNYLNRKTLIMGPVNSGKTRLTATLLNTMYAAGWGRRIVVLDLAPDMVQGIGGKLDPRGYDGVCWLTCPLKPPRLSGRDSVEMQNLAEMNAQAIEPLLDRVLAVRRTVLVINDASMYLQAGSLRRFKSVAAAYPSAVMNAYHGDSFIKAPFTEIEHLRVENLARWCDRALRLSPRKPSSSARS
jgi:hypothetical protein